MNSGLRRCQIQLFTIQGVEQQKVEVLMKEDMASFHILHVPAMPMMANTWHQLVSGGMDLLVSVKITDLVGSRLVQ